MPSVFRAAFLLSISSDNLSISALLSGVIFDNSDLFLSSAVFISSLTWATLFPISSLIAPFRFSLSKSANKSSLCFVNSSSLTLDLLLIIKSIPPRMDVAPNPCAEPTIAASATPSNIPLLVSSPVVLATMFWAIVVEASSNPLPTISVTGWTLLRAFFT